MKQNFNTSYVVIKLEVIIKLQYTMCISIHLMLLLNLTQYEHFSLNDHISIHLMLLLNQIGRASCRESVFEGV